MANNYYKKTDYLLFKVTYCDSILKEALESLEKIRGHYYALIKEYILIYDKLDPDTKNKIKNIIFFIQEYALKIGEKNILKKIKKSVIKFSNKKDNLYKRFYIMCIKYNEDKIINTILNS